MTVYALTFDGCDCYGAMMYFKGVFSSLEAAEKAKEELDSLDDARQVRITELTLDENLPILEPEQWSTVLTDALIGGYCE